MWGPCPARHHAELGVTCVLSVKEALRSFILC